jgi:hypothetical protein
MTATDQVRSSTGTGSPMPAPRTHNRALLLLLGAVCAVLCLAPAAHAAGPELTVSLTHDPATFQRGDLDADVFVTVTNTGDAPTGGPVSATLVIPAGLQLRVAGGDDFSTASCPSVQSVNAGAPFTCTTPNALAPGETTTVLQASLIVAADAPDEVTTSVTASAAGASDVTAENHIPVIDRRPFDLAGFTARSLGSTGDDDTVAGGHPYEATASFAFPEWRASTEPFVGGFIKNPVEDVRNIWVELPAGFVGAASAAARCPLSALGTPVVFPPCPPASRVGTVVLTSTGGPLTNGLFNVAPEKGYPAEFAFKFAGNNVIASYPQLRPRGGGYGLNITVPGASRFNILSVAVTLWGVPSQHPIPTFPGQPDNPPLGGPAIPFLSNQSDCLDAQPTTKIYVDSWQHPARMRSDGTPDLSDSNWKSSAAPAPAVTGCDNPVLADLFKPSIENRPTPGGVGSSRADAASGYQVDLDFPQPNDPTNPDTTFDPDIPSPPALKDATVKLPAGVAINPSSADGLDGCSDLATDPAGDQVDLDSISPVECPEASKIGAVVATTPLLASHDADTDAVTGAEPIDGDIYLIKPHAGDLDTAGKQDGHFRVLIQLNSERYGLNVKLPGVVVANKNSTQLTATFTDNPQLPVKNLELTFKTGDRSPLVNPITCGAATTNATFTPWSRGGTRSDGLQVLGTPDATASSAFNVSWDGRGAACPAKLPFAPSMDAGLVNRAAGGSSPFSFDLSVRKDREDFATGLSVTLPGGLLAAVKNVPLCTNEQANSATCPDASRVGSATVAAGAGDHPFYLSNQPVWLTGPYNGGPYGLAIAVHAKAGPFDLGNIVVRQALKIDINDTHVTVVSDPVPTVWDGVPLRVRKIHVDIDRPGFMRAPTSCDAKTIGAKVLSQGGASVNLSQNFQVTGCDKLPFSPRLLVKLTNSTQTKVGGHPGLDALVTQKPGEAALKSATVTLPLALALDPDNAVSDSLCEFGDGLKDQCPEKSVIGSVTAISPLLKTPLTGKVYFVKNLRVSSTGRLIRTLPTLLVALRGEINVDLRAETSVPDNEHLVTTFPLIPDAAISSFNLKLNGGKKGILVVTDGHDTCKDSDDPFFAGVGQNGKRVDNITNMVVACPLSLSRTFTSTAVKVKVSGIGAGTVTVSGTGVKTTKRKIASSTIATITAKLTAKGRQLRRQGKDVRVKVSFLPKGSKKTKVAYSALPKAKAKK